MDVIWRQYAFAAYLKRARDEQAEKFRREFKEFLEGMVKIRGKLNVDRVEGDLLDVIVSDKMEFDLPERDVTCEELVEIALREERARWKGEAFRLRLAIVRGEYDEESCREVTGLDRMKGPTQDATECELEMSKPNDNNAHIHVSEIEQSEKTCENDPPVFKSEDTFQLIAKGEKSLVPAGEFGSLGETRRRSILPESNIMNEGVIVKFMIDYDFFRKGKFTELMPIFCVLATDLRQKVWRTQQGELLPGFEKTPGDSESNCDFDFEEMILAKDELNFQSSKEIGGNIMVMMDTPKGHEPLTEVLRHTSKQSDKIFDEIPKPTKPKVEAEDETSANQIDVHIETRKDVAKTRTTTHQVLNRSAIEGRGRRNGYGLESRKPLQSLTYAKVRKIDTFRHERGEGQGYTMNNVMNAYHPSWDQEVALANSLRDGIPWYVRRKRVRHRA